MLQTLRLILFIFLLPLLSYGQKSISLAGEWEVAFDSDDAGSHLFLKRKFSSKINLPGTTDEAYLGDTIKFKPSLTRESLYQLARRHRFVGTAWYRRTIDIPTAWAGQEIELYLERVLWQSRVFIDGKEAHAQQKSLTTPHRYNLTGLLTPGSHTILMRINNARQYDISYQNLAHAYTDGTQTIWNGVIGKIGLTAKTPVNIQHIQTFPIGTDKSVTARIKFQNNTGHALKGKLNLAAQLNGKNLPANEQVIQVDTGVFVYEVKYDLQTNFQNWDEFSPSVYQLDATFIYDNEILVMR